jgi:hypothetical protein
MRFKAGDTVQVLDTRITNTPCRVLEVKGSVLIVEDASGAVHELYTTQVQKQMLFG